MNFAERAFRYLFRKKGKAIILFWVLLITETMILSTVTILRASEVARIELLGKSKAKLLIEREKSEELFTDDEYKKLEKLEEGYKRQRQRLRQDLEQPGFQRTISHSSWQRHSIHQDIM